MSKGEAMAEVDTAMATATTHDLYVNHDRTVLARVWDNGTVEVATRDNESQIWGPPVYLYRED